VFDKENFSSEDDLVGEGTVSFAQICNGGTWEGIAVLYFE
jgi:hypothetical protein